MRDPRRIAVAVAVVVVVAIIGYAIQARLSHEPDHDSLFAGTSPFVANDFQLDGEAALPVVPVDPSMIAFALEHAPTDALDVTVRFASDHDTRDAEPTDHHVDLVASYRSASDALAAGRSLDRAVGDDARERTWLALRGVNDAIGGFGWVGERDAVAPFVQVVGRHLVVAGLAYDESLDSGTRDKRGSVYAAPLVRALRADGAALLVEGDRSGEGAIMMDLTCSGPHDDIEALSQDVDDTYSEPSALQPPWIEPGITDANRRARRTQRFVQALQTTAFINAVHRDREIAKLREQMSLATGDVERSNEIADALRVRMEVIAHKAAPELSGLVQHLDAEVVRWMVDDSSAVGSFDPETTTSLTDDERAAGERELTKRHARLGRSRSKAYRNGALQGGSWVTGDDLAVGFAVWNGLAQGFGPFVDWLAAGGCDDIHVAFMDFDDVRRD